MISYLLALKQCCMQDLAGGFMSGKLMLKLDAVRFMLANHTQVNAWGSSSPDAHVCTLLCSCWLRPAGCHALPAAAAS